MLPYAVVRPTFAAGAPAIRGVDGRPVEFLAFGAFAVAVSRGVAAAGAVAPAAFLGVLDAIAAAGACLPMRRASRSVAERDLRRALAGSEESVLRRLDLVDGCEEWSVRIESPGEDRGDGDRDGGGRGPASGAAYLESRRAALAEAGGIDERAARFAGEIARAGRGRLRSSRLTANSDGVASVAMLVERSAADEAVGIVEILARRRGAACTISGPWPPFTFAGSLAAAA